MNKPISAHLKLHHADNESDTSQVLESISEIAQLCSTLGEATGWGVRAEIDSAASRRPDQCEPSVELRLERQAARSACADRGTMLSLIECLQQLLDRKEATERALLAREAELATAIPVVWRPESESAGLAARLQSVLKGIAEALDCAAAALYLLDDATSHLKLRSQWGLTNASFMEPPRLLNTAIADLEAMLGHAVVLEDTQQLAHWNPPADFPSSVCVPVSSPNVPLGTLWLFSEKRRDFDDHATNLVEMAAGRMAADLERQILLREVDSLRSTKQQIEDTRRWQTTQLPNVLPLIEGWDVAALRDTSQLGGDFFDWHVGGDGFGTISLLSPQQQGFSGTLTSSMLLGALRSIREDTKDPSRVARRLNELLWQGSTGDAWCSMFHGRLNPRTGRMRFTCAGPIFSRFIRGHQAARNSKRDAPVGSDVEASFQVQQRTVQPGDTLLLASYGMSNGCSRDDLFQEDLDRIAREVTRCTTLSADEMAHAWANRLRGIMDEGRAPTVLIARRLS